MPVPLDELDLGVGGPIVIDSGDTIESLAVETGNSVSKLTALSEDAYFILPSYLDRETIVLDPANSYGNTQVLVEGQTFLIPPSLIRADEGSADPNENPNLEIRTVAGGETPVDIVNERAIVIPELQELNPNIKVEELQPDDRILVLKLQ